MIRALARVREHLVVGGALGPRRVVRPGAAPTRSLNGDRRSPIDDRELVRDSFLRTTRPPQPCWSFAEVSEVAEGRLHQLRSGRSADFFASELELFLSCAGFDVLPEGPRRDLDPEPTVVDVVVVVEAR